jgi:plasmid stability protein
LVVPDLDDALVARLTARAAKNGRSVEEEVREILARAAPAKRESAVAAMREFREQIAAGWTERGIEPPDSISLVREDRER